MLADLNLTNLWAGVASASFLGGILGAAITGLIGDWSLKKEIKRNSYIHMDEAYNAIIERCTKYPQFANADKVGRYRKSFSGDELQQYEAHAWMVHNFLETIYDLSRGRFSDKIDSRWEYLFDHFARLHLQWALEADQPLEPGYLNYLKTRYAIEAA